MRIYSKADFNDLSMQVGTDPTQLVLLEAYERSREELAEAISEGAPHSELASLRAKRSAARWALTRSIDPDQDARRTRGDIASLEIQRKKAAHKVSKLQGDERIIAELKLEQFDALFEGQRWLLRLYSEREG